MYAIVQRRYGVRPEDVLAYEQIPVPVPGPHEVLVRVHAASVDRGTWHLMAGLPRLARLVGYGVRRPGTAVPGLSLAGTVHSVGAEVSGLRPGDAVLGTGKGAFAEFAVARADRLVGKPAAVGFDVAATVPDSGVTALQAVRDMARVRGGDRVAVLGASGGVGCFAVQLAKTLGATVTGVASGAKADYVRALGADDVVDYENTDFTGGAGGFDVIVDTGGNRPLRQLRRALTSSGRLVIVGGENAGPNLGGIGRNLAATLLSPFVDQTLRAFVVRPRAADAAAVMALIDAGRVAHTVDRTYPLSGAAEALRLLADGRVRGKVVLVS